MFVWLFVLFVCLLVCLFVFVCVVTPMFLFVVFVFFLGEDGLSWTIQIGAN